MRIRVKPVRLSVWPLSPQISRGYCPPILNPLIPRSMGGAAHVIRSFRCWSTYVGGGSSPLLGTKQLRPPFWGPYSFGARHRTPSMVANSASRLPRNFIVNNLMCGYVTIDQFGEDCWKSIDTLSSVQVLFWAPIRFMSSRQYPTVGGQSVDREQLSS